MAGLSDNEIQRRIAEVHNAELKACRDLLGLATEGLANWSGRAIKRGADRIILAESARATKTFDGVIRMCADGFGEQAAMLNRSLFEAMAIVHWVSTRRREAVSLFVRHHRFTAVLWYETFDRVGWLSDEDRRRRPTVGPKQRRELEKLFGKYGTAPWVRRNLPTVLEDIEHLWDEAGRRHLWAFHDIPHRHNNQMLHSTSTSAGAAHIGGTATDLHFTIGPSNQLVPQALLGGYWTFGQVFSLLIDVFRLTERSAFRTLFDEGITAFSDDAPLSE